MSKPSFKIRLMSRVYKTLKRWNLPKRKHPDQIQRILIVSNTGIGDTMWGTPAFKELKKQYPKSFVCVLASPLSASVLKHNPYIDEIVSFKKRGGLPYFFTFASFYKKRFDTILFFHCSYKWTVPFTYFLAPKRLVGFHHDAKQFHFLLTHVLEAGHDHPIIQRLKIVETIGVNTKSFQMHFHLSDQETKQAKAFLENAAIDTHRPLIGLQPGAKDEFKRWPIDHFCALAKQIEHKLKATIVIFGDQSELELAKTIQQHTQHTIVAAGKLPLRVSAALLSLMDGFVTNDTGPLHLALSFQMPIVTIFGPTPAHLCWPHLDNPKVKILSIPKTCIQCVHRQCKLPYCLSLIQPEQVMDALIKVLDEKKIAKGVNSDASKDYSCCV